MFVAFNELGVKERAGAAYHPRILEYLVSVGIEDKSDEIPWCSAFVEWCLNQAGIEGTGSGLARSWLEFGSAVPAAEIGDIVVFKRGLQPWMGHVGFFLNIEEDYIYVLGGNQGNEVSVKAYLRDSVIGIRRV